MTDPPDLSSWALVSVNNFDSGATPVIDAVPHALLSLRNRVMRSLRASARAAKLIALAVCKTLARQRLPKALRANLCHPTPGDAAYQPFASPGTRSTTKEGCPAGPLNHASQFAERQRPRQG